MMIAKNLLSYGFLLMASISLSYSTLIAANVVSPKLPPVEKPQVIRTAETPNGMVYPKNQPQLEFISFEVFDKEPVDENVKPKDKLPKSKTTYVYAMLTVRNFLYSVKDQDYKITYKYYSDTEQLLGQSEATFTVKKEWKFATYYSYWGWDQAKNWAIGNYTLELWIDDHNFAVKKFSIVNE